MSTARNPRGRTYERNSGLERFTEEDGPPFCAWAEFQKADLDEPQILLQQLAERTWNQEQLAQETAS